jgi:hypothetical protein
MSTKQWLYTEHFKFYDIAKEQTDILYFDIRCWTKEEIIDFFVDVRYGDYQTYEKAIRKFPEYKTMEWHELMEQLQKSENRYLSWRKANPILCEWRD